MGSSRRWKSLKKNMFFLVVTNFWPFLAIFWLFFGSFRDYLLFFCGVLKQIHANSSFRMG